MNKKEFDFIFGDLKNFSFSTSKVKYNLKKNNKEYEIEMALPGINKKDLNIEIVGNNIEISYEKTKSMEQTDTQYTFKSIENNSFTKEFSMPKDVDVKNIESSYKDGILSVKIPRSEENIKKIEIK